jgi:signal transduction histidine kinase
MVTATSLLAVIVGGAFVVLLWEIDDARRSSDLSQHSQEVLAAANGLERLVIDLETGERGYLLTGEESFLEPWRGARAAIPVASKELDRLAVVPIQDRRARLITEAIKAYVRDYSLPLIAAARRGDPSVTSVASTAAGKRYVDGIRADFDRLVDTEGALAIARQHRSDVAERRAVFAASAGVGGSVVLLILFARYLSRAIVRPVRRAASMAVRLAGGDLTVRMPETGIAEVGALERSFNTMGRALEESRAELTASRARIVATSDETRRRIERDLHDGAQQRLVSLGLEVRAAEAAVPPELPELAVQLSEAAKGLTGVVQDIQEISRGIHPAILSKGGVGPALRTLARRSAIPVELDAIDVRRLPGRVEVASYFVVSEALTNAAKHSDASVVHISFEVTGSVSRLSIRDDGVGGAEPRAGTGLIGLRDRVEALGGTLEVTSPPGGGTALLVTMPMDDD